MTTEIGITKQNEGGFLSRGFRTVSAARRYLNGLFERGETESAYLVPESNSCGIYVISWWPLTSLTRP